MAKAVVPVVIKLLAEADSSIEGAVNSVRDSLKQASQNTLSQLGGGVVTAAKDVAFKLSKALSDAKIGIISEKSISLANTGLQSVKQSGLDLQSSLENIKTKFAAIPKAAEDVRATKPYDLMIAKSKELSDKNFVLTLQLVAQKKAAEELAKAKPEDRERQKNALDAAKILTAQLQKEAQIIQGAYTKALNEVKSSLVAIRKEQAASGQKTATTSVAAAKPPSTTSTELELIRQKFKIGQDIVANEDRVRRITQDRISLEQKIAAIQNATEKAKLSQSFGALTNLGTAAQAKGFAALSAQKVSKIDTEELLKAQKSGSPNIQVLKQLALQSKLTAESLSNDAKKAEQSYTSAFSKIQKEYEKALKGPGEKSSRLGGGLGIFSPIANQLGSALDQIIGSVGIFRTTAGIQIGQALSQGIGQGIAEGNKNAGQSIDDLVQKFNTLDDEGKQVIANLSTAVVVGAAAATAALGALAFTTVKVAAEFEVLTAKLTTTFKDPAVAVERFQQALELAAKTPYNVEQVVAAQVQLAALGQKNIGILQSTIDLASGLNADLARTANEVGKAAAGSLRGYQELRNTLGITQERLKQFGGVVDSQNRLLVQNEYQIKKNREALLLLIKTDFGGSAERLSQTLTGRISNLQDEILKLSGAIGSSLLPQVKSGVEGLSFLIGLLNSTPPVFKTVTSGIIVTGAALGALTVTLAASSVALGFMGTALTTATTPAVLAFAAAIPGATTALLLMNAAVTGSVTGLAAVAPRLAVVIGAVTRLGSAALGAAGLGTSLLTAAAPLAALVVTAGLLNTAINAQAEEAERTAKSIKKYADEIANARRANLELKGELVRVFELPEDFLNDLDTTEQKIKKIQDEFDRRGAFRLAQDLGLAGLTGEQLTEKFTAQAEALRIQEEKLKAINELRDQLLAKSNLSEDGTIFDLTPLQKAIDSGVIPEFAKEISALVDTDPTAVTKKFAEFSKVTEKSVSNLKPFVEALRLLTNGLSGIESVFDKTQKQITRGAGPAKFALKVGDINLINSALKEQEAIQKTLTSAIENTEGLREKSARGTKFSIEEASRLLEGSSGPAKKYLEDFIANNELITQLTNKRVKVQSDQEKYRLQELEASEKKALAVLGKSSKDQQLLIVNESIKLVKAKADLYQADLAEYNKVQRKLQSLALSSGERFRLQNQADRLTEKIDAEKKAFDLLIELEKKKATVIESIEADSLKKSKKNIQDKYDAQKQALDTFVSDAKQIASGVRPTELTTTKRFIGIDGKTVLSVTKPLEEFSDAALTASEKIEIFQNKLFELRSKQAQTKFDIFGDKADELKKSYRDAERELEIALDRAKIQRGKENIRSERTDETGQKRVVRENFADFKTGLNQELAETIGKEKQLEVIQKAKLTLLKEESLGHITNKQYRTENAVLTKKERDLQLDLNRAVADQTRELEKIRAERIADEIEILELKKQGASSSEQAAIDSQIKGRRKQKVQEQFNELQAELKLELEEANKNGKNRDLILEKYAQKQESLVRKAYLEHQKAEQDKLKATTDRLKAEEDALKGFREKRLGGRNSPLISIEELSFQSTLSGFGSDAESRLSRQQDGFKTPFGDQRGGAKIPSYESYKAKFEQENNLKLGKDGKPLPSSFDNLQPINTGGGTQITNYVNIDSRSVGDADIVKAGADLAMSAMAAATKSTSLISGNKGGAIQAKPFGAKPFGAKQIGSDAGFGFSL